MKFSGVKESEGARFEFERIDFGGAQRAKTGWELWYIVFTNFPFRATEQGNLSSGVCLRSRNCKEESGKDPKRREEEDKT